MVFTKKYLRLNIVYVISDKDVFLITFTEQNIVYRPRMAETKVS